MLTTRLVLLVLPLLLAGAVFSTAGPRSALLLLVGVGFGLVLEGLRFGFAGPWRLAVTERDGRGVIAQLVAIGLTALIAIPLLDFAPGELAGAHAPIGLAMIGGAFVFGAAMQIVMGCGSGTLVNAGSGNLAGAVALVGFIIGSFAGTLHLDWWTSLGSLPVLTIQDLAGSNGGLAATLAGLLAIAVIFFRRSDPGKRLPPGRLWVAAVLLAVLAVLNLVIAGQPWGIVYGLGLWGAKAAQAGGMDVAANVFWSNPTNTGRLNQSVLTDFTSLTNFGIVVGALVAMRWRPVLAKQVTNFAASGWASIVIAGLLLGYSARLAFGCNVGAFFSGISTGSLHGWVWFAAAFAGSFYGIRLRPILLRLAESRQAIGRAA
ncbi:YeeE/YedE family protein [Oricola cellulosilytica]|uniref:YeeE/YedE family protein n=1 Tax=Oricola cellulosilytica TaxID=1429082 RepID=UPI0018EEAC24|nr:YeeE/YedE family protein [Oricola cellulosilytica]